MKTKSCPCNSEKLYLVCCGKFHKGKLQTSTAEALMRSRFSAYVLKIPQYIYRTWDKETRPPLHILREDSSQVFTSLEVLSINKGGVDDDKGTVEFIASYTIENENQTDNTIHQHHENSYFVKIDNKWKYVDEVSKIKTN